jgi:hypothetical protein
MNLVKRLQLKAIERPYQSPRDHASCAGEGARRTIRAEKRNAHRLGGTLAQ